MSSHVRKQNNIPVGVDGVDHINISWTNAKTDLGLMLCHYFESPFVHPTYGSFKCMEGMWHYIKTEEKDESLRILVHKYAHQLGRKLTSIQVENFWDIVLTGNYCKIDQNPTLKQMLIDSTLPFEQYYVVQDRANPGQMVTMRPKGYECFIQQFELLRVGFRNGWTIEEVASRIQWSN